MEGRTKIRFKKLAKTEQKNVGGIPKSLTAFSEAQKEYAKERKTMNRRQKKLEESEKRRMKKAADEVQADEVQTDMTSDTAADETETDDSATE